jgi:hypothetical protein
MQRMRAGGRIDATRCMEVWWMNGPTEANHPDRVKQVEVPMNAPGGSQVHSTEPTSPTDIFI